MENWELIRDGGLLVTSARVWELLGVSAIDWWLGGYNTGRSGETDVVRSEHRKEKWCLVVCVRCSTHAVFVWVILWFTILFYYLFFITRENNYS
jgi:hypothetical protein